MHPGCINSSVQLSDPGHGRPGHEYGGNSTQTDTILFHMMISLKPSCSPSPGPEPYLLPHFSLQAISSPGSCYAHQAAWGPRRASSPARLQCCCQVIPPTCSCGPDQVICMHIWKCMCGRLWTPCPSSDVFKSKPALCHHCAFKEPCVSLSLQ